MYSTYSNYTPRVSQDMVLKERVYLIFFFVLFFVFLFFFSPTFLLFFPLYLSVVIPGVFGATQ